MKLRHVPAKLTRPSSHGVVPRSRLARLLDADQDTCCIWVTAPGGSGKTAATSSWVQARQATCVWYQCDRGDADAATFFHYLGEATKLAVRGRRRALAHFTPEYTFGIEVFARRFFEGLFSSLGPQAVLVLDDYHEIPPDAALHGLMNALIASVPSGSRVIVLSRDEPPHGLARWRADGRFVQLNAEDLALTTSEAQDLARSIPGRIPDDIGSLNALARGWVAGLLLLLREGGDAAPDLRGQPARILFDYLATEVFARIEPALKDFLIRTSRLPFVTPMLARQLSLRTDSRDVLADLRDRRLFTDRRSGDVEIYEYHPLFRQFLHKHASSEWGPARTAELIGDSADALASAGHEEAALELYLDAARWEEAARLMLAQAQACMALGRLATLDRWIERLPEMTRAQHPWIEYWRGTCRTLVNPAEGRTLLVSSFERFKAADDRAGCLTAWAGISESYFFEMGDFSSFAPWMAELDRLLPTGTEFPDLAIEVRVISGALGMLMHRPDHPAIARWAERALALIPDLTNTDLQVQLASFASCAWLWRGDFERSVRAWNQCAIGAQRPRSSPLHRLMLEMNVGSLSWQLGEHAASRIGIEGALTLAADSGIHILDGWFHIQSVYAALSEGNIGRAERHLAQVQAITPPHRKLELVHIRFLQAGVHLRKGDLRRALSVAEPQLRQAELLGAPFGLDTFRIQTAQMLMLSGRNGEARELLGLAREHAIAMCSDITLFHALMNIAWSMFDTREDLAAREALAQALAIGARRNYMNCHPWWIPEVMSRLLSRALASGIEVEYVCRLIRHRAVAPESLDIVSWPWPIRIVTLGEFRVEIDGAPLSFEGKAQAKPLELLKALLSFGGRGVRAQTLIDALWPHAEGDAGQRAWDVTLHRLRRLLGHPDALVLSDSKLSLSPTSVWTDVRALEMFVRELESGGERTAGQADALAHELLSRYRGEFLAHEGVQPWLIQPRDRLRRDFQRSLLALGAILQRETSWNTALELYRAGIERDPIAEAFYQESMRCLGQLGLAAEVARTYRTLHDELARTLGMAPSARSQTLLAELARIRQH